MMAPCGMLFLWLSQAYISAAFPSTAYRDAGEPTAGEPVTASTCRILTASGEKLKDRKGLVIESSAAPPEKWTDDSDDDVI